MRVRRGIVRFANNAIAILAAMIILGLLTLSFFVACRMHVQKEHIFFLSGSIALLLAALVSGAIIFLLLRRKRSKIIIRRIDKSQRLYCRILYGLVAIFWLISIVFVLAMRLDTEDRYDQGAVSASATKLNIDAQDDWLPVSEEQNGYLGRWPNQAGLVLFEYVLSFIFGTENHLVLSVLNCIFLALMLLEFERIFSVWGWKNHIKLLALVGLMLFLPFIHYCTYAYGNIIGLFFAMRGMRRAISMIKLERRSVALCCLDFVLAIIIKQNYIIFAVASALYLLMWSFRRKLRLGYIAAVFLLLSSMAMLRIPQFVLASAVGADTSNAAPAIEWVNMGLSDDGAIAPGWWNSNIKKLEKQTGVNGDEIRTLSEKQLKRRIKYLWQHKKKALIFFARKIASSWLDSNFEGLMIMRRIMPSGDLARPGWAIFLVSAAGEELQSYFMRPYVALVLFGSAFYLLDSKNRKKLFKMTPLLMAFMGGFVFHLFWETKSQYTFEYFVLLIPFAAKGSVDFYRFIFRVRKKALSKRPLILSGAYAVIVATGIILVGTSKIATDNKAYANYYGLANYYDGPADGTYRICLDNDGCLVLNSDVMQIGNSGEAAEIRIKTHNGVVYLSAQDNYYLKRERTSKKSVRLDLSDQGQKWRIVPYEDGYAILEVDGKRYLNYDASKKQFFYEVLEDAKQIREWRID